MDLSSILTVLRQKNIDPKEVFQLVDTMKQLDLHDEKNLRYCIQKAAKIAHKDMSIELENKIVKKIQTEGITSSLLDLL